jgi:hypothetical protein
VQVRQQLYLVRKETLWTKGTALAVPKQAEPMRALAPEVRFSGRLSAQLLRGCKDDFVFTCTAKSVPQRLKPVADEHFRHG